MLFALPSYYAINFAGKIDVSLGASNQIAVFVIKTLMMFISVFQNSFRFRKEETIVIIGVNYIVVFAVLPTGIHKYTLLLFCLIHPAHCAHVP